MIGLIERRRKNIFLSVYPVYLAVGWAFKKWNIHDNIPVQTQTVYLGANLQV